MDAHALQDLEREIDKLLEHLRHATERQAQLSHALVKSKEEVDRLRAEVQRFRAERTDTRRKVDALLREFESLDLRFEGVEQ
jgi:septal ring factor EnvC (AmiA/AmiB activator)